MGSRIHDRDRLAAVRESGLVDSAREAVFDELTKAAARLLDAPFAFMTAVDDERSFWKSTFGIDDGTRANAVSDSFCQYVIEQEAELIVGDVTLNDLTKENPSIESMGVRAWAGCPVTLHDQVLGTFCVVDQRSRTWSERDREVLRSLSEIANREIRLRAELHREQAVRAATEVEATRVTQVLDTLRRSLVPSSLPPIDGFEVDAWFRPAPDGDLLLGDFYDVFPIDDAAWGIVIGDVCGHGVEAARLTSLARYTLRAAARHHDDPADALAETDDAMFRDSIEEGRFATACYLRLDDGGALRYASAGHPAPLLLEPDGSLRELAGATGPPLGVVSPESSRYVSATALLGAGSTVVLYTDGITEARHRDDGALLGEDRLRQTLADRSPASAPIAALAHLVDDERWLCTDDIAVVTLHRRGDRR